MQVFDRLTLLEDMCAKGNVTDVVAGGWHTICLVDQGAFTWGRGLEGQLGHGILQNETAPVSYTRSPAAN